ncbi:polysaccharide pyruvyl transferase family protein [Neobacillus niacini]|uniref:polysaccharide pyruvyl transferase family protein n=1 Tax=Neobacillus niacini TaxID=86668 RepID=UPI003001A61C
MAITYAQVKYLEEHFPHHKIVTIFANDLYPLSKYKTSIHPCDIITIIGGGNMGDSNKVLEDSRRYIIKLFPKNKIISFPQSIEFKSHNSLHQSIKVYGKHPNLHIFAREPQSYELMKTSFLDNHVYLVPDIVLSLKNLESQTERVGITICLRNDLEKYLSDQQKESLIVSITKKYENVARYDTVIANLPKELGEQELNKLWAAFRRSKVVITDRLHGMIFCAITKTPCLVFPNSNHKIASTYQNWLGNVKYIKFVEKFDEEEILANVETL